MHGECKGNGLKQHFSLEQENQAKPFISDFYCISVHKKTCL